MRSLLSEGKIRYETVEKTQGGLRARLIEREGPTGLLLTTTATKLHPENETRLISITVTDTPEQTRAVLLALADEAPDSLDLAPWHALQEWVETGERRVEVPFAKTLAQKISPKAVRLRRDFRAVLELIRAHALIHQAQRERNAEGWIVAAIDDYAAVFELVADLINNEVEATVSITIRQTVDAVQSLESEFPGGAPLIRVAAVLGLEKGTTSRRVTAATERGYLDNLEGKKGRPARLMLGDPMPEGKAVLPEPSSLG